MMKAGDEILKVVFFVQFTKYRQFCMRNCHISIFIENKNIFSYKITSIRSSLEKFIKLCLNLRSNYTKGTKVPKQIVNC